MKKLFVFFSVLSFVLLGFNSAQAKPELAIISDGAINLDAENPEQGAELTLVGDFSRRQERRLRKRLAKGKPAAFKYKIKFKKRENRGVNVAVAPSKGVIRITEDDNGNLVPVPAQIVFFVEE